MVSNALVKYYNFRAKQLIDCWISSATSFKMSGRHIIRKLFYFSNFKAPLHKYRFKIFESQSKNSSKMCTILLENVYITCLLTILFVHKMQYKSEHFGPKFLRHVVIFVTCTSNFSKVISKGSALDKLSKKLKLWIAKDQIKLNTPETCDERTAYYENLHSQGSLRLV